MSTSPCSRSFVLFNSPVRKHGIIFEPIRIVVRTRLIAENRARDILRYFIGTFHGADEIRGRFQNGMETHEVGAFHRRVIDQLNGIVVRRVSTFRALLSWIIVEKVFDVRLKVLRRWPLIVDELNGTRDARRVIQRRWTERFRLRMNAAARWIVRGL